MTVAVVLSAAAIKLTGFVRIDPLVSAGIDREHAEVYSESIRRGSTLVIARVLDEEAAGIERILANQEHFAIRRKRVERVELTPRELEIVHLIAERLSNKEIAKRLCVSLYTVKNHVHNIVEKLQVKNRFEAVEYAHQRRWLKGETSTAALGSSRR